MERIRRNLRILSISEFASIPSFAVRHFAHSIESPFSFGRPFFAVHVRLGVSFFPQRPRMFLPETRGCLQSVFDGSIWMPCNNRASGYFHHSFQNRARAEIMSVGLLRRESEKTDESVWRIEMPENQCVA
ncbi:hypothetical protein HMPREF9440_00215 [Sutterella parvirubra YIT 11816]|uniref:Uncharacterized protein n=1 Tax=Sutterella parvirubra YIT 11816 TaxID=762967 RepID=H3KBW8_9BURK|nr:hypothetical protein HMPREF9440_00215 [Sutterella parvirubra YIT 11816]